MNATSTSANIARDLVEDLQGQLAGTLRDLDSSPWRTISWQRDQGRHGGGNRIAVADSPTFGRASINISQVHYEDLPDRALGSATALSTIVHPAHPLAPSMHMHISWTEMRNKPSTWRLMADLNPSHPNPDDSSRFEEAVGSTLGGPLLAEAKQQGERYFFIPCLNRHRGVSHFYLEGYRTPNSQADLGLARAFGETVIEAYGAILRGSPNAPPSDVERAQQRAYHTSYFLQVLTLDRGTTSGLLVHNQNDLGILGSLPGWVDRDLLVGWIPKQPTPQDALLTTIVEALPPSGRIDEAAKLVLAQVIREHYNTHPEALHHQARGNVVPPTVANHSSP